MRDVYIVGIGMTRFGRHLGRSEKDLVAESVSTALSDARLTPKDIRAACLSNSMWGYFSEQHCIRGQVALRPLGIMGIPVINVENACAGASTAFHLAWQGVACGLYDCALAVGVEKLFNEDKIKTFKAFSAGMDVSDVAGQLGMWRRVMDAVTLDIPAGQENSGETGKNRTAFMDVYAAMARWHMAAYGTTQRQMAIIASKNHFHGSLNPLAQFQNDMSVEEVLTGRPVTYPLTVPMCAPIGDGGAAAVLCSANFLKNLNSPRPVKVLASVPGSGTDRKIEDEKNDIGLLTSRRAYDAAGVGPGDIDVAEVHDATAFGELHQTEALSFCEAGGGGPLAESGATRLGGRIPVNTSGGLESRGHPVGASGLAQLHELVVQLRHEAGPRQVEGCRLALAENGGGNIGYEEAAMCVHILERVE